MFKKTPPKNNQQMWSKMRMSLAKHSRPKKVRAQNYLNMTNSFGHNFDQHISEGSDRTLVFSLAVRILCEPVWLTTRPPAPSPQQTQSVNDSSPLCKYDFPNQFMQTKCEMHVPSGSQGTALGTNTDRNTWWAPPWQTCSSHCTHPGPHNNIQQ